MSHPTLFFKLASQPHEFEQIHRLNYQTFVEEIPQHPQNSERRLVDKFHAQNQYHICVDGERVVGMLAIRGQRPFSLDAKVENLDSYLPANSRSCEFRLLAVDPEYRSGWLLTQLLQSATAHAVEQGYTLAIASGTLRQVRLYRRMGFVPFAKPVGSDEALYQPMYLPLVSAFPLFDRLHWQMPEIPEKVSFLPGPVEIAPTVQAAFHQIPISHRSEAFMQQVKELQQWLCTLTGAQFVSPFLGSGTLANDVVAAQLSALKQPGLILVNGEFGERLVDHATRLGLEFEVLRSGWGESFDFGMIDELLQAQPQLGWLWSTHCETSTGVLNDLEGLSDLCQRHEVKFCLDATSSLGVVPVDLSRVYLASSVSGKGLASFTGISLVFHNHTVSDNPHLPRYLDLGYCQSKQGVPFTQSSNLIAALRQAVGELQAKQRFATIRAHSRLLRNALLEMGLELMAAEEIASPAVLSVRLPAAIDSSQLAALLRHRGYLLSYQSDYLLANNIIQICLMGQLSEQQCRDLVSTLAGMVRHYPFVALNHKDAL